jgi:hypothetical protein
MRARTLVALCVVACAAGPFQAGAQQPNQRWVKALVVAVPGDKQYHVAECPRLKGAKSPAVMTPTQAEQRELTAHDCLKAIAGAQRAAATEQLVWVDLKTKRYHLTGCSLVGLPRAQMPLDQAMATYRPCNACKPPRND